MVDLSGRIALVTGGRIKIGYATATRLLRQGARVVVTSRFAHDAAHRFAAESDFPSWKERLEIHGLDFMDPRAVLSFADGLRSRLPWLDILINNAAQTVKRPDDFYAPALARRHEALPPGAEGRLWTPPLNLAWPRGMDSLPAILDRHGQPQDTREQNSWTLRAGEIPTVLS